MGNCMEYCTKGIVLSIKDYYDMANNDHKPVSPETKSIQPDMCVDGNITMVKNIQPAGDYTGVSCMIYDHGHIIVETPDSKSLQKKIWMRLKSS